MAKRGRNRRKNRRKEPPLLDCKEVKRRLGVNRETVYRWLAKGMLKGTKVGRVWRVSVRELERFAGVQGEWTKNRSRTPLLSTTEVAERLNVCRRTVANLIRKKKLKARKIGKLWKVSERHLERFIERKERRKARLI